MSNPKTNEEIIVEILKEQGCNSQADMITPANLVKICTNMGIENPNDVERTIMTLIDKDIIEYEMDENLQASELWLI
jgi:hypothetical protein